MSLIADIHLGLYKEQRLPSPSPYPQFYRVLHDIERGGLWRFSLPEVFLFEPNHATPFTKEWQLFSFSINPFMTGDKWRSLYSYSRAFTNNQGFDKPGDPRADYVNGRDLIFELPKFDKPRICGGASLTGVEDGEYLLVNTLDTRNPPPSLEYAEKNPWLCYFDAITIDGNGTPRRFPQGDGERVFIPLVTSQPVKYPLQYLQKMQAGNPPADPYKIYL